MKARQIVEDALKRLPTELKQQCLEEELAKEMAAPLEAFAGALDAETEPARVAALAARARRLVDELGAAIQGEVEKRAQSAATEVSPRRRVRRGTCVSRTLRWSGVSGRRPSGRRS